jgi:hypothetical protein
MKLYAWIGEDERGTGIIGLKQARVPAGYIPLVCIESDRHKLETPFIRLQLQLQADVYGKTIRFVAFELVDESLVVLEPRPQG